MISPKNARDPGLPLRWFPAMTALIESIDDLLVMISQDISDADGIIARYLALQQKALALRNTAGPEMSILSATILSGKPIKPSLLKKIGRLQVETAVYLQELERLSTPLGNTGIPDALKGLRRIYFDHYLPRREAVLPAAIKGGPYPYSQQQFLEAGVKALESIAALMDQVVAESNRHALKRKEWARNDLWIQGLTIAGTMAFDIDPHGLCPLKGNPTCHRHYVRAAQPGRR